MQNKQTYTVSNLVAKYINTKDEFKVALLQDAINAGVNYCGTEYGTGEELLAHLYKDAAGDSINEEVWNELKNYEQDYNPIALDKDEYEYLLSNFSETVEFIMSNRIFTPINENYEGVIVPMNVLECAIKAMQIDENARVYLPNAGYGDAFMLIPNPHRIYGYINNIYTWALAQVRFFAAGIEANIECLNVSYDKVGKIPTHPQPSSCDVVVSSVIFSHFAISQEDITIWLTQNGKAIMFTNAYGLANSEVNNCVDMISTVLQFPEKLVNYHTSYHGAPCALLFDNTSTSNDVRFVDLSSCHTRIKSISELAPKRCIIYDFDQEKALNIFKRDSEHCVTIKKNVIDDDILLPAYYLTSRPKIGYSINKVMTLVEKKCCEIKGNMRIVSPYDLAEDFSHSRIDVTTLADEWNAIFGDTFYIINEPCVLLLVSSNKILSGYIADVPSEGIAVCQGILMVKPVHGVSLETATLLLQTESVKNQLMVLTHSLSGKNTKNYFDKVIVFPEVYNDDDWETLYDDEVESIAKQEELDDNLVMEESCESLVLPEEADSVSIDTTELSNQDDSVSIDNIYMPEDSYNSGIVTFEELVYALQVSEEERKELLSLTNEGIRKQRQDIHNNLVEAVGKLREENKKQSEEYETKLSDSKTDYINEVRMRKHDMRPHLRQIASTERLLTHYADQATDIEEFKLSVRNQVARIHDALKHLSDLVEHLTDEEMFGVPERFNIDKYLDDLQDGEFYTVDYDCDEEALLDAGMDCHRLHKDWAMIHDSFDKDGKFDKEAFRKFDMTGDIINLDTFIAPVDFERMVQNIIENAKRHGFTDPSRGDYNIYIYLSIDKERGMYVIDFRNNGNPLPEGMDKFRFGIKGERGGKTGGTGQGGHIIKSIVEHYGGDYDIFSDEGVTNIRIYLPILR